MHFEFHFTLVSKKITNFKWISGSFTVPLSLWKKNRTSWLVSVLMQNSANAWSKESGASGKSRGGGCF